MFQIILVKAGDFATDESGASLVECVIAVTIAVTIAMSAIF